MVRDTLGRGTWLIDEENDEVALLTPFGSSRRFPVGKWPQQLIVESSGRVFVSCRQAGTLEVIDTDFARKSIDVGEEPRALALDEDGHRLYVGLVTAKTVLALDTKTLLPAARVTLTNPPRALALTSGGLAVASQRSRTIQFFSRSLDAESMAISLPATQGAITSPAQLVPAGDGLLVVAERARTGLDQPVNFGGYGGGQSSPLDAEVFLLSKLELGYSPARRLSALQISEPVQASLRNGVLWIASRGKGTVMGLGVDPDLERASAPLELVISVAEDSPLRRGRAPAGFSTASGEPMNVELDLVGFAFNDQGQLLLNDALNRRVVQTSADAQMLRTLSDKRTGIIRLRRGWGMRDGDFGDFDFAELSDLTVSKVIALAEGGDPELRVGAHLFHNSSEFRISSHGVACASCHPDGRDDGRVWQLKGTRRQTPMLTGRLKETAPYNWLGGAPTLKANLVNTITERLEGEGLGTRELKALTRFVSEGLRPVSMPAPKEAELVAMGAAVFNDSAVGCATCHPADLALTDGERHDVGSLSDRERREFATAHPLFSNGVPATLLRPMIKTSDPRRYNTMNVVGSMFLGSLQSYVPAQAMRRGAPKKFDTPSLKYVALSAPYFHDGAAQTLEELIAENHDRMGTTSQLSALEQRALSAYLQTL
jgi:cytochrome c peroxidase